MTALVTHNIPIRESDRDVIRRIGEVFGGLGPGVEIAIEWRSAQGVPANPEFPGSPRIHPALSKPYLVALGGPFTPAQLGQMLSEGAANFASRFNGTNLPPRRAYITDGIRLPSSVVHTLRVRAFDLGEMPEIEIGRAVRETVEEMGPPQSLEPTEVVDAAIGVEANERYVERWDEYHRVHLDLDRLVAQRLAARV